MINKLKPFYLPVWSFVLNVLIIALFVLVANLFMATLEAITQLVGIYQISPISAKWGCFIVGFLLALQMERFSWFPSLRKAREKGWTSGEYKDSGTKAFNAVLLVLIAVYIGFLMYVLI